MRAGRPRALKKERQEEDGDDGGKPGDSIAACGGATHYLTFKLDLIKSEMISRANAGYRPRFGVDVRSLRVLRAICDTPGITASVLKEQTLIEKTLLSKLLSDLIDRNLVRRSIHPDDARHFQLWPTAAGKRMRESSDELGQSMEAEMLSILSASERRQLNSIVDKLVEEFRRAAKGQS
ncbi:MarR family winged helix-turn-helix transcriptional regulator [Caballeronia sp. GAFFF1]|uniref:MarR family winged helix-turn-helix transcriptional regulator n=1 Tax=Caballeronia sp. GAFFF1 TaxID=2921779 RepID=UPI002027FD9A|nr:MarR family winged helix-turn-helix transcriptional regulator [Caballeronia sp. GAFFF1]